MNRDLKVALILFAVSYSIDILIELAVLFIDFSFEFYYWMGWVRLLFSIAYGLAVLMLIKNKY